jgi:hypothetical protein
MHVDLYDNGIWQVEQYWKKRMGATEDSTWEETHSLGVKKCIAIAVSCVYAHRANRPTTKEIIDDLDKLDAQIKRMSNKDPNFVIGQVYTTFILNSYFSLHVAAICVDQVILAHPPFGLQRNSDFKNDIAVDPSMELRFPFDPERDMSCCLQLTNKGDSFIAFNIKTDQNKYSIQPNKGTLPPCSRRYITLTSSRAQEMPPLPNMQCFDIFVVQCTRVSKDFTPEDITEDFLTKARAVMDEITLPIVYIALDHIVPN